MTLRRLRAITGMKYKLERGIWITPVPQGYSIVRTEWSERDSDQ